MQHHGTSARMATTGRPAGRSLTHAAAHKGQMVIKSFLAVGDFSSTGRPTSCPGTPAPAAAHRETSSSRRPCSSPQAPPSSPPSTWFSMFSGILMMLSTSRIGYYESPIEKL